MSLLNVYQKSENLTKHKDPEIKTINSLVLFSFRTKQPSVTRLNKRATRDIIADQNADKDSARMYNTLLKKRGTVLGTISSLFNSTSKKLRSLALSHPAGGYYLRVKDVENVQTIFDEASAQLRQLKAELLCAYDDIPRPYLSGWSADFELPDATTFAEGYSMTLEWMNSPASISGTVLEGVSNEVASRVKASSEKSHAESFREAHGGPIAALLSECLLPTIEQMTKGKRLRGERFENIKKGVEHLQEMNWLKLPEIDTLVEALKPCCIDRAELKNDRDKNKAKSNIKEAARVAKQTLKDLGL